MLTVFSIDLGTTNCGFSIIEFYKKKGKLKYKIKDMGLIKETLVDLKDDPRLQLNAFGDTVEEKIKKYKPDCIVAERFLIRSFRTPTAEQVTAMLGYLFGAFPNIPIYPYTAVTWKNNAKRVMGYAPKLDPIYKEVFCLPHELDSVLMAVHHVGLMPVLADKKEKGRLLCEVERMTVRPRPKTKVGGYQPQGKNPKNPPKRK